MTLCGSNLCGITIEQNKYSILIGRYNDINPVFNNDRVINNYVIARFYIWRQNMESIDLKDDEYLILYDYFFNNKNYSKVINKLIIENFNTVSIKLAINLIKSINK